MVAKCMYRNEHSFPFIIKYIIQRYGLLFYCLTQAHEISKFLPSAQLKYTLCAYKPYTPQRGVQTTTLSLLQGECKDKDVV